MMRQNRGIPAFTISPIIFANAANTGLVALPALPASSLNGAINTFLSNNVVTTQITPELKSKLELPLLQLRQQHAGAAVSMTGP